MAASLLKIVASANTTTTTDAVPTVTRYFYTFDSGDVTAGTLTIANTDCVDDNGDAVAGDLTTATANNGYYLLFINGELQEDNLYTVTTTSITVNDATNIADNSIVSLVVTNFAPSSSSTTTITT